VQHRKIVDLSHPVTNGMRTYPGIPAPTISAFLTHEASRERYQGRCELTFSEVRVVAGVGTYLDAPYHRDATLPDFASLPIAATVDLPAVVIDVDVTRMRDIHPQRLGAAELRGHAVLIRTGFDRYWETDRYWTESPFLVSATAERLVDAGAVLLGVDFLNVDDTRDPSRPVHTTLLRAKIPIVENLCNLADLPVQGVRFHAPPAPFVGVASFPVRAYAVVEDV
jgi:kynurenine formamidase